MIWKKVCVSRKKAGDTSYWADYNCYLPWNRNPVLVRREAAEAGWVRVRSKEQSIIRQKLGRGG